MYEDLLQSPARPFRATPDAKFYFPHESIESAKATLVRAVERAEGPAMVLGGAGLGKSILADIVSNKLSQSFDVVTLNAARLCSRRALLQSMLFELGLPYKNLSEGELRLSIMDRLEPNPGYAPDGLLIMVDEAHTLPTKLLEELRLITNFTRNGQPRARLVLIGGLQLEDTFASPAMESFNQRLAARCYLAPMTREQTERYVAFQLEKAGFAPYELINEDGLQAVYTASEGVPRITNQIMDHALVLAITNDRCPINSQLVEEAWADLQQLPAPWQSVADLQPQANAAEIEFGELGENDPEFSSFDIGSAPFTEAEVSSEVECEPLDYSKEAGEMVEQKRPIQSQDTSSRALGHIDYVDDLLTVQGDFVDAPAPKTGDVGSESARQESNAPNFFAAFSEPVGDLSQIAEVTSDDNTGHEMNNAPEPVVTPETEPILDSGLSDHGPSNQVYNPIEKPEVVLVDVNRVFAEGRHAAGHEFVESNQTLPADSFFKDKPTDEKLIALEDEQQQYDSMGVWENDPPISAVDSQIDADSLQTLVDDEGHPNTSDGEQIGVVSQNDGVDVGDTNDIFAQSHLVNGQNVQATDASLSGALFGDDFDEEVSISIDVVNPNLRTMVPQEYAGESQHAPSEIAASEEESNLEPAYPDSSNQGRMDSASMVSQQGDYADADIFKPAVDTEDVSEWSREQEVAPTNVASPQSVLYGDQVAQAADQTDNTQANADVRYAGQTDAGRNEIVNWVDENADANAPNSQFTAETAAQDQELERRQAEMVADHVARIQEFADSVAQGEQPAWTVDDVLSNPVVVPGDTQKPEATNSGVVPWAVEVNTVDSDKEANVQNEIEDIVSQLNFSAFAVEPYSVEQISLDSKDSRPVDEAGFQDRQVDEASSTNVGRSSYPADSGNLQPGGPQSYDDDRDLLVIEEEVTAYTSETSPESQNKTTRTTPYNQLFARLRG